MTGTSRLAVLNCPACGGALGRSVSSGFLDCRSCGEPLAVRVPNPQPRHAQLPRLDPEEALAVARAFWEAPTIPRALLVAGKVSPPQLVFVAFYDVERTQARGHEIVETSERARAVSIPELSVEGLERSLLTDPALLVRFEPAQLQRRGVVFDPSIDVRRAVPLPPASAQLRLIEERVSVVYLPLWLVRCHHGRNLYEAAVDGTNGVLLQARAPATRTPRLPAAIAAIYLLAATTAAIALAGLPLLGLLAQLREVGFAVGLLLLAGLAWLVAWSWDRVRFRYEVVTEGGARRLVAVNRPKETLPQKTAKGLAELAGSMLSRGDREQ